MMKSFPLDTYFFNVWFRSLLSMRTLVVSRDDRISFLIIKRYYRYAIRLSDILFAGLLDINPFCSLDWLISSKYMRVLLDLNGVVIYWSWDLCLSYMWHDYCHYNPSSDDVSDLYPTPLFSIVRATECDGVCVPYETVLCRCGWWTRHVLVWMTLLWTCVEMPPFHYSS